MTVTFTYLESKCEYDFKKKNLQIISERSFNVSRATYSSIISKEHNIEKKDIKTITFKHPNTKLPSHIYKYFSNYPNLESIELEKLDFKNVETIDGFIDNCPKLKEINITHKNAENLTCINDFISQTINTKSITIKDINAPNLKEVKWLLWNIETDIKEITIENITAPNIKTVDKLIDRSTIKTLDLTKIGDVNVYTIQVLISDCEELETLNINPLTKTKIIGGFIKRAPALKTEVINKINKVAKLEPYFLTMIPKNEALDLDKFEDITNLTFHIQRNAKNKINKFQYTGIKIGKHKIKIVDYATILTYNIPILDKTEEEIVKSIISQSKNETKKAIGIFLNILKTKDLFKDQKHQSELISKLTIIKNLK